jgi:hypothetical protein
MEETQKTHSLTQAATNPSQIWHTLAKGQQDTVYQTVVRICSRLIAVKEQGGPDEPKPSH